MGIDIVIDIIHRQTVIDYNPTTWHNFEKITIFVPCGFTLIIGVLQPVTKYIPYST